MDRPTLTIIRGGRSSSNESAERPSTSGARERFTNPDEEITRPDLPVTSAAPTCVHCGRVFGDHAISKPPGLVTDAKCGLLRRGFKGGPIHDYST
jgi:hypothetical protein